MVETETKYSIWLKPEAEQAQELIDLVAELAIQYQAPLFVPHLTLMPDISKSLPEVLALTEQLAHQLQSFEVVLNEVAIGETYFQCLFVKAVVSDALMKARNLAATVYGQPQLADIFMPHLSLLYGTFDDTVKALARELVMSRLNSTKFNVNKVVVYTAQPDPRLWQEVGSFKLNI